jgi:hypothetical protein
MARGGARNGGVFLYPVLSRCETQPLYQGSSAEYKNKIPASHITSHYSLEHRLSGGKDRAIIAETQLCLKETVLEMSQQLEGMVDRTICKLVVRTQIIFFLVYTCLSFQFLSGNVLSCLLRYYWRMLVGCKLVVSQGGRW